MGDPVDVIGLVGVGPALAKRLNEFGVFTTSDLLRVSRDRLAGAIEGASVDDVRVWQTVAHLLETEGANLELAESLQRAGISSLEEFGGKSLSEVRAVLTDAQGQGGIAAVPGDDEIVALIADAVRLRYTGVLNGTVLGRRRARLAGVRVVCESQRGETDERGRFRFCRLPLARPVLVHLDHPEYASKTVEATRVVPQDTIEGEQFRLAGSPKMKAAGALSELAGDELPPLGTAPVRIHAQDGAPTEDDILRVVDFYADGDVRVVSRLLNFEDGEFFVRTYRFAKSDLPHVERGDDLRMKKGKWTRAKVTPQQLAHYRDLLRVRRQRPPLSEPPTDAELARLLDQELAALSRTSAARRIQR